MGKKRRKTKGGTKKTTKGGNDKTGTWKRWWRKSDIISYGEINSNGALVRQSALQRMG